jgi:uncharacterized Zn-binding protein involved in type VI secretion
MGKLVVVQNDAVKGTDTHNVSGVGPNPAAPPPLAAFAGTGSYQYTGSMTDSLSTFVQIGGKPVALVTSKSSLNPNETTPPTGGHSGPAGSNFAPGALSVATLPLPLGPPLLIIKDVIGTGVPNAAAGSALLTIGGVKVLLDGDKIDTCDGTGSKGNSIVTAAGQSFVSCSG